MMLVSFNPEIHSHLLETLTTLLHEAYAPLAARGMKYMATHQSVSKTMERLNQGESYLGFIDEELVSTVTLRRANPNSSCEYYRKFGVFSFGQFAVISKFQKKGLGSKIMDFLEMKAKELGAKELALDTSENADGLIRMYENRGYKIVSYTQWNEVNYRSVIMSKVL